MHLFLTSFLFQHTNLINMKIGIYCGSFNPVHNGHIKIVNEIINQKIVDKVLIVPTGSYWDKDNLINLEDRINMLSFFETDNIIVEREYNVTSSTFESFNLFKKRYPNDELYLILGADNLLKFENWIEYKKLLEYPFIIVRRGELNEAYINEKMNGFNKTNYTILNIPVIDIASTDIRSAKKRQKLVELGILDEKVYKYITDKNLL